MVIPLSERFWKFVDKGADCWLWKGSRDRKGYGRIGVSEGKTSLVHRVAWELTYGQIPPKLFCCHHCDNPPCVRPEHLFLGTNKDNMDDMRSKGRGPLQPRARPDQRARGSKHGIAKVTEEQVLEMRQRYGTGSRRLRANRGRISQLQLAEEYGLSQAHVSDILRRVIWTHIP